ncbi:uncharacterized protein LOC126266384 [Aethina tumida]|uniref:uncharacterized protein LOC126266384 n=1 Tax=Aethina tumida TaxID=116153 RepID=UPI0021497475|nr:uncharacterized protein LOC126266384 [Aethina tumida]
MRLNRKNNNNNNHNNNNKHFNELDTQCNNFIVQHSLEGLNPEDRVGFSFFGSELGRGEAWARFKPRHSVSADEVLDLVQSVYQSNSAGVNTETYQIKVTIIKMPVGMGRAQKTKYNSFEEECAARRVIHNSYRFAGTLDNYKEYELWNCARKRVLIFPRRVPGFRSCKHSTGYEYRITVFKYGASGREHSTILNYILTKTDIKPNLIMRGTKIILAEVGNVRILDSLNYFPMALAKLPKAFGLAGNFKKGYFPHLENQQYVDPLPSAEFYGPNQMKPEDRHTFLNWHQEHQNDVFNFQEEIVAYCKSDVEILMRACLSFRSMLLNECKVCPFTEATTIASACNKVFARNYLEADTIAVIPRGGYRMADNQSVIALQWLLWEENVRGITIHHAGTVRSSVRHSSFMVVTSMDAPAVSNFTETHRLEEVNGYHAKSLRLHNLGFEVIEMWECNFRTLLKQSCEVRDFVENHPVLATSSLNPRDRNTVTYYKCNEGERIKYIDVCSLYPFVCKYRRFPLGHPTIHVGSAAQDIDLSTVDGMVKCKILPPTQLYHLVLPVRMKGKLMFALCNSCGESSQQRECSHMEEERLFTGTWVIAEVLKALEKGYRILEVFEVRTYETRQYNHAAGQLGLFTERMNKFIKIKQEASGWPADCVNDVVKQQQYLVDLEEAEKVKLTPERIENNPGL